MAVPAPRPFQYIDLSQSTFFPGVLHVMSTEARPLGMWSFMLNVARELAGMRAEKLML